MLNSAESRDAVYSRLPQIAIIGFSLIWLVFLGEPVVQAFQQRSRAAVAVAVVGLVAFIIVYVLGMTVMRLRVRAGRPVTGLATGLISCALISLIMAGTIIGQSVLTSVPFLFVLFAIAVDDPRTLLRILFVIVGLSVPLMLLIPGWHFDATALISLVFSTLLIWTMTLVGGATRRRIEHERREAELAAQNERLRISRDVHDLLGHSLTVITLKAQLAQRLLEKSQPGAAQALAEIEEVSRSSLSDVRGAVQGMRTLSLAGELASARRALAEAGLEVSAPHSIDGPTGQRRELFAWALREAVTNILRHASAADRVTITIDAEAITICDNGPAVSPHDRAPVPTGSGLRGVRERAAALGGSATSGIIDEGDGPVFRVRVHVPAGGKESS